MIPREAREYAVEVEGWEPMTKVTCDLCDAVACWMNRAGGRRCDTCLAERGRMLKRRGVKRQ